MTSTWLRGQVRPGVARASLVTLLVLIPFVAHSTWDYIEARRIRTRLDAIAARGEPVSALTTAGHLATLRGDAAASARLYHAAAVLVGGSALNWPRGLSARVATARRTGEWSPELVAALAPLVAEQAEALAMVDRAQRLSFAGFTLESTDPALVGRISTLATLCAYRAVVRAAAGDGDGAMQSIAAEAAASRGLVDFMVPRFSEVAYVLARTRPSRSARGTAESALARLDRDDRLGAFFIELRLNVLKELERTRRARNWEEIVLSPMLSHRLVTALDGTSRLVEASRRPWPDRIDAVSRANWPFATGEMFQSRAKAIAEETKAIRCARLLIADGALDLVDPFSGRRLDLINCR